MLLPVYRKNFEKDVKRIARRRKNRDKLKLVIRVLLSEEPLPSRCRDHTLSGNDSNHRECHIEPDWLLIYKVSKGRLILERTGSHSDLF